MVLFLLVTRIRTRLKKLTLDNVQFSVNGSSNLHQNLVLIYPIWWPKFATKTIE